MSNQSIIQLSLFGNPKDNRPLPLIVADKWQFPLQHQNEQTQFNVLDWIAGMLGYKPTDLQARNYASKVKASTVISNHQYFINIDGDLQDIWATDKGLYAIAQNMRNRKSTPQVESIKRYLVEAGAFADLVRRDPEAAVKLLTERTKGIKARNDFTEAAYVTNFNHRPMYAALTDTQYRALFGMVAKQLEVELGGSVRDNVGELALSAIRQSETAATMRMNQYAPGTLHDKEQVDICFQSAMIAARGLKEYADWLQVDTLRNKPLLKP